VKLSGAAADRFVTSPDDAVRAALFFGPDNGLARERAAALARLWSGGGEDPFALTVMSEADLKTDAARLRDEAEAQSLTGGPRLIRLRMGNETGAAAVTDLIAAFDETPDRFPARLVVEAGDLTPRSKLRKAFESAKTAAAIGCYTDSAADALALAERALAEEGLSLDRAAREPLARALSQDRGLARQELDKLILYKGVKDARDESDSIVTAADVAASLGALQDADMDVILEAAALGQGEAADQALRRALESGLSPIAVIRAASRHMTRLHQARAQMERGDSAGEAMKSLRPPVFYMRQRAFGQALNAWRADRLERALNAIQQAEKQCKTSGLPDRAIVGRLLLAIASMARPAT